MIGAPARGVRDVGTRVPGSSRGASAPAGAPALPLSDQATTRPSITESRPVVGRTPLLPFTGRNSCRSPAKVVDAAQRPRADSAASR